MRVHFETREGFLLWEDVAGERGRMTSVAYVPPLRARESRCEAAIGAYVFLRAPLVIRILDRTHRAWRHVRGASPRSGHASMEHPAPLGGNGRHWAVRSLLCALAAVLTTGGAPADVDGELPSPTGPSPAVRNGPGYPGYDFSVPFRLDIFFAKHVPQGKLALPSRALRFPVRPDTGFLRTPQSVPPGENLYALGRLHELDVVHVERGKAWREPVRSHVSCAGIDVHALPREASIVFVSEEDPVFLSAPEEEGEICRRARVLMVSHETD